MKTFSATPAPHYVNGTFFQVPFIVYELNAFAQNKALDGALKQVKAICPNVPTMFISADQEAGKVLCMAQVSKEVRIIPCIL